MDQELLNDIISTSCGGAAAGLALYIVQIGHGAFKDWRDSKKVYDWMVEQAGPNHGWEFRSTRAISSYTNLTEDRVRELCSNHSKIYLSTGLNEDLWTIDKAAARRVELLPD